MSCLIPLKMPPLVKADILTLVKPDITTLVLQKIKNIVTNIKIMLQSIVFYRCFLLDIDSTLKSQSMNSKINCNNILF
ncbi:MAG: hypothetical protein A3F17_02345 [Gammaproteobacteria bacterium RIFCSPHIGHO2_12_FULL_41_15]|nr:MAG: hypothetical protein A3F17_02345 [Gammaproteobacteria bacterium RIFCSPHIGHO2_12_FULL_41_15]